MEKWGKLAKRLSNESCYAEDMNSETSPKGKPLRYCVLCRTNWDGDAAGNINVLFKCV